MRWNTDRLRWYLQAGKHSDYPRVFIEKIKPFLRPEDVLLDIGSGPGLFSRELVAHVKKVYNLEPDPLPRKYLEKVTGNCEKIEILPGSWPEEFPEEIFADVTISAFSGSQVMSREESLKKICRHTCRHVFLIAPAGPKDFGSGLERATSPLPYRETEAALKKLDLIYQLELISFDFGQPVQDMEEATSFLSQQLRISPQMARNHASRIARPDGEGLYLPNLRRSALIRIDLF